MPRAIRHVPDPYPDSGPWRSNKDEIRYKEEFGEKVIPISEEDDLQIDGKPVDEFIQEYHSTQRVAASSEKRNELEASRGKLVDDFPELTAERMSSPSYWRGLRDALRAAFKKSGNETMAETFSTSAKKKYVVSQLGQPDPSDSPVVKAIKRYGNSLNKNRSGRNAKADQGEKVAEAIARLYVKRLDPRAEIKILHRKKEKPGAGTIDIVAVVHGKLILIEAKTGDSKLQSAIVEDDDGEYVEAFQGTRLYLRAKLQEDGELRAWLEGLQPWLKKNGYSDLFADLHGDGAEVGYYHLHAPLVDKKDEKGNLVKDADGNPVRILGASTIRQFDVGGGSKFDIVNITKPPDPKRFKKPSRRQYEQGLKRLGLLTGAGVVGGGVISAMGAAFAPAQAGATAPAPEIFGQISLQSGSEAKPGEYSGPSEDGMLVASVKEMAAEFERILSSFRDYVQNGLNSLSNMVGDATTRIAGMVTELVDSVGAQKMIDDAAKLWAEGQDWINLAMLLSPVGSVTAAISAAITAIQQLVAHWDQIRAGFDWVLKNLLEPAAEFFKAAFKVYITPYRVVFDLVMAGFNGMSGVVRSAVGSVTSVVAGIVKAVGGILQKVEINIDVPGYHHTFGLRSVGDAMVAWASARMADGGLVRAAGAGNPRPASGIQVMAIIDQSVLRAARDEERKIGYAYRPPFLHDGALTSRDVGPGPRIVDLRVPDVDSAFAQIRNLQARHDMGLHTVGV